MSLSNAEKERYTRQVSLNGWDQAKLKKARVLIAGCGGLGSASAFYLAAAGVGTLVLCDGDRVERSDLNRQILYGEESVGRLKVEAAKERLLSLNSDIHIDTSAEYINGSDASVVIEGCDMIVDGLDNIEGRHILNRLSVEKKVPYMYGAIGGWQGYAGLFHPPHTACLSCVMPQDMEKSGVRPVAGFLPGTIGLVQATAAIKYFMGLEQTLEGKLCIYDSRTFSFEIVNVEKRLGCFCGQRPQNPPKGKVYNNLFSL